MRISRRSAEADACGRNAPRAVRRSRSSPSSGAAGGGVTAEEGDPAGLVPGMRGRVAPRRPARARCSLGPVDFDLSPEHALLRDTIRDFMRNEVAPVVDEHEKARRFPRTIVDRLGEMGWLGIPIPEDEGGA